MTDTTSSSTESFDKLISRIESVLGLSHLHDRLRGVDLIVLAGEMLTSLPGYGPIPDGKHKPHDISNAAACYAASPREVYFLDRQHGEEVFVKAFPWSHENDRRGTMERVRELAIAGALCAAEIDRIMVEEMKAPKDEASAPKA